MHDSITLYHNKIYCNVDLTICINRPKYVVNKPSSVSSFISASVDNSATDSATPGKWDAMVQIRDCPGHFGTVGNSVLDVVAVFELTTLKLLVLGY